MCRLRDIPIITFINKVDREGLSPLELIDEIQDKLALDLTPVLWPIGQGVDFGGYIDLVEKRVVNPQGKIVAEFEALEDLLDVAELADNPVFMTALETLEMAQAMLPSFDLKTFHEGHLSPVLFGSALKGVSVAELLRTLGDWGPEPRPQPALPAPIAPGDKKVTGFVFKVQANMDANHRDRIAFVRLCSGKFARGMRLKNVRSGKDMAVSNPMFFFGNNRELAEEAVAGDIVAFPITAHSRSAIR